MRPNWLYLLRDHAAALGEGDEQEIDDAEFFHEVLPRVAAPVLSLLEASTVCPEFPMGREGFRRAMVGFRDGAPLMRFLGPLYTCDTGNEPPAPLQKEGWIEYNAWRLALVDKIKAAVIALASATQPATIEASRSSTPTSPRVGRGSKCDI